MQTISPVVYGWLNPKLYTLTPSGRQLAATNSQVNLCKPLVQKVVTNQAFGGVFLRLHQHFN